MRELAGEIEQRFPNARGYFQLAHVYELTGDLDVGIAYGLRAYRLLNTGTAVSMESAASQKQLVEDTRGQIAELYAKIGDFDKATEFEPDPGVGQFLLRRQYERLEDTAQEIVIGDPGDLTTQYYLAFAYNATGDFRDAKYLLEQLNFPLDESTQIAGPESEASTYYIDALQSLGGNDALVRELARKRKENFGAGVQTGMDRTWWVNTLLACTEAQLGDTTEVIAAIDRVYEARGLPRLPLLQDSPCFSKRLASEPRYIALIEHLRQRQKQLRERLPATLAKYGVADVRP